MRDKAEKPRQPRIQKDLTRRTKRKQTVEQSKPDPEVVKLLRPSIPAWLDDCGLPASEFRVFCHVARRESGKGGLGCCNESIPRIAKVCRLSENTVRKSLQRLTRLGLLTATPRQYATTIYRLVPKSKDWTPASPAESTPF